MNGDNFELEDSIIDFYFIIITEYIALPNFLHIRLWTRGVKINYGQS